MFLSNNKKRACSRCHYESSGQAQREIFKYIEIYYNIKKCILHWNLSPSQFEELNS
ncbi:IS3 family transposase [Clostridium beijerinckii]|uniref:IS3 family transposase n=1 Tax=Clostridium beijerinckii TaxID=1520 RepID=UPI003BF7A871